MLPRPDTTLAPCPNPQTLGKLLRDELSSPSQLNGAPVLERYAPTGHLERRIAFPAHSKVSSFVIHPSGGLSVFVLRDDDGDLQYGLQIVRLSPDGEAVAATSFDALAPWKKSGIIGPSKSSMHGSPSLKPTTT